MGRLGEFTILERMIDISRLDLPDGWVGPGDDAAVLHDGLVVSTDMAVQDTHFRMDWIKPDEIGFRAAGAALSDLSAMGAKPLAVLVSIALPAGKGKAGPGQLGPAIQSGVAQACARAGAFLVGGDLAKGPGVVVDVVVIGRASNPVLRSGASVGDEVWVSGRLGGAAAAVDAFEAGRDPDPRFRVAFTHPPDRSSLGQRLAKGLATAMIDISDGLVADAGHLAAASGVRVELDEATIPVPDGLRGAVAQPLKLALEGGEDYELLFTAKPGSAMTLADVAVECGVPLTRIGTVVAGEGVAVQSGQGIRETSRGGGYDHFR